jgi:hypothetical protein
MRPGEIRSGDPGSVRFRDEQGINMATETKELVKVLAERLTAGAKKHFASSSSLRFGGGTFTPAQVEAILQTIVDLRTAVDTAKANTRARIAAEQAQMPPLRTQMDAFVAFVRATFGSAPDVLADFGLEPRKARTPLTTEQLAARIAKSEATRAARHTMGRRARKDVKGTITTIVAATSPAPAHPIASSPAAGAPATPAASNGPSPHTA